MGVITCTGDGVAAKGAEAVAEANQGMRSEIVQYLEQHALWVPLYKGVRYQSPSPFSKSGG